MLHMVLLQIEAQYVTPTGKPGECITDAANKFNASCIVMGNMLIYIDLLIYFNLFCCYVWGEKYKNGINFDNYNNNNNKYFKLNYFTAHRGRWLTLPIIEVQTFEV